MLFNLMPVGVACKIIVEQSGQCDPVLTGAVQKIQEVELIFFIFDTAHSLKLLPRTTLLVRSLDNLDSGLLHRLDK